MNSPPDFDRLMSAARPTANPALRARVLAAAADRLDVRPWWARRRTWAVAAALLFTLDVAVNNAGTPAPAPRLRDDIAADIRDQLPPICRYKPLPRIDLAAFFVNRSEMLP